jgi:hypothetical protein
MAHGRMHGAALAAALAVITCLRARDCPRALALFAGPSWRGLELAGLPGPAAEGAADWRPPAASGPGAVTRMTAVPGGSRFTAGPLAREILARYAPSAGRRGWSCACSGSENAGRRQVTDGGAESPIVTLRGGSPTKRAIVSDHGIARAASAGGRARRGALPADTTRKGEFAMRDTWT